MVARIATPLEAPRKPPLPHSLRAPAMAVAAAALLWGMALGLARLGWWSTGPAAPDPAALHGPLMVNGFLGTFIALERAVGLSRRWALAAPALSAAGTLLAALGAPAPLGQLLVAAAAAGLVALLVVVYRMRPDLAAGVLVGAAALWAVGNGLWAAGLPLWRVVPWWVAFLALTICGERLELARMARLGPGAVRAFAVALAVLAGGLCLSLGRLPAGVATCGLGLAALGSWLLRFDIAWRTLRLAGLPRYAAVALLAGYGWLLAGGLMWAARASRFGAGLYYDAMLHAILLGFVISMIFAHAPMMLPAVAGLAVPFTRALYLPLGLLHLSVAARVAADVAGAAALRQWSGLANAAAILLFLAITARAAASARHASLPQAAAWPRAQASARAASDSSYLSPPPDPSTRLAPRDQDLRKVER